MKRIFVFILILIAVIGVVVAIGLIEPNGRLLGYLRGEQFYAGRPTSYWARQLATESAASMRAMDTLVQARRESVGVLKEILSNPSVYPSKARISALEVLSGLGYDADSAIPVVLNVLNDEDPHLRALAATILPNLGASPEVAVEALTEQLKTEPTVTSLRALSEYKAQAVPALPAMVKILENESLDTEIRWNAARTLGKIGPAGADAIPALVEHLDDEAPTIREHAAEALGDIGPPAANAVGDLIPVLKDPVPKVRRDAVRSLGQIGEAAKVAVPEILPMLNDPEEIVRVAARNTLQAIAPEQLPKDAAKQPEKKG